MTVPALAVRDLAVAFGGVRAVDGIAFDIAPGERRAVIGPNGAGKTTLFNLIAGQVRPSQGTVHLLGRDVTRLPPHRRARAGLARTFQTTNLLPALSVRENVLLAVGAAHPRLPRTFWRPLEGIAAVSERAEQLLRSWDLWSVRDTRVDELSHGRQRVLEIVMALAADPKVLLLDEPTAGLSSADAQLLTDITAGLPADVTLLLIEHDMRVAFALADVVTVLVNGRVLATGSPEDVRGRPDVVAAYLGGVDAA